MTQPVQISLVEGYRSHFVSAFLTRYGAASLFVRSVADCLTARHVNVLKRAGRVDANTKPLCLGTADALKALESLLERLKADGAVEHVRLILRESMGVTAPEVLEAEVDRLYGRGVFARWLALFETRSFDRALEVLHVTH